MGWIFRSPYVLPDRTGLCDMSLGRVTFAEMDLASAICRLGKRIVEE